VSSSTTALRRAYSIHGIAAEVLADKPAVVDAMDLRLRGFAGAAAADHAGISFEFVVADVEPHAPSGPARPVYDTPHGSLYYFDGADVLAGTLGGVHLRCEPAAGRALISAPSFTGHALYFATHPLATVALMVLMERHERFSLHAGCVAGPDGSGVLLSGPSGAGKSTLALALARAGMGFISDDVVFIERAATGPGALRALGFADTLGVSEFAASQFPELRDLALLRAADGFPKRLARIEDLFGLPPMPRCEPRAIVFPEATPELPSAVTPLDGGEAMLRLVPDVLLTHHEATQAHLATIGALLEQVRCYVIRSGSDLRRAAELVRALV
jgi:hypothetical protein